MLRFDFLTQRTTRPTNATTAPKTADPPALACAFATPSTIPLVDAGVGVGECEIDDALARTYSIVIEPALPRPEHVVVAVIMELLAGTGAYMLRMCWGIQVFHSADW